MSIENTTLYERNVAAVVRHFPELGPAFERLPALVSKIVGSVETADINLDLGHTTLYSYDAVRYAEEQVDAYLSRPNRIYLEPPYRNPNFGQQQFHVTDALYQYFEGREIPSRPAVPRVDPGGYLLIYGIGLGFHLPRLLKETPVRHILVVEEHLEFFWHSLTVVDWSAIFDRLDEKGQTIFFVFGSDPGVVSARVHWYMRGAGFGLIDGSYVFRHYSSTLLDTAHQDFVEKLPLLPVSIGYFEDELVMLRQCTQNLLDHSYRYLDVRPRREKDVPAIIVGSGPSLDSTIADLRRLQDRAIIFSSGTALRPLLRYGIRPDFHCELENGRTSVEHVEQAAAEYDLDGITLIGSTTVHPDMLPLFGDKILYFRDSVSSTPLWDPTGTGILGTAPTCTNLALRAAMVMAFREVYLFGVDLGTRDASAHHARDAIYHQDEKWLGFIIDNPVTAMTIELPGNFGGRAYTNQILHWARMMMVQTIEVFSNAKIYNCSDGTSIPGTLPKLSRTIQLKTPVGRKNIILARLREELDAKKPGEMVPPKTLDAARVAFREYYRLLRIEIAKAADLREGFIPFYARMLPYLARNGEREFQTLLRSVNIGTLMMCFQSGFYFCRRVPETEESDVMKVFLDALDERVDIMARTIDYLMSQLQSRVVERA